MMDKHTAVKIFSALAHDGRVELLRRLVVAGDAGLNVGRLAEDINQNIKTISAQLLVMANAGLLSSTRSGKQVVYRVDFEMLAALFAFVMHDCCGGHGGLRKKILEACC